MCIRDSKIHLFYTFVKTFPQTGLFSCLRFNLASAIIRAIVTQSEGSDPWASVRDVEPRQPGGVSIAARRVGLQHGGPESRKPHQLVRVRSVGRLLTVCGRMRNSAGQPAAQGQPGQGGGNGGGARVVFGACGTVGAVVSLRY